jgi:uncharacterized protein (DUF427 family)
MGKNAKSAAERQESIWDYPRPPRAEDCFRHIQVVLNGVVIADSRQGVRVLESGHPPVLYIPPEDVLMQSLEATGRRTQCEFKGEAHYFRVQVGERTVENAVWSYPEPLPPYERIKDYLAFYANRMDACLVDGEVAAPESGDFYGGWITREITGFANERPGASR